jgi:carbon-monoxide dehydrogenase small subunit
MSRHEISVKVNGETVTATVEARLLLVHLIRDELGLTGTHVACDTTSCGACTVVLDQQPVKSCTVFAVQADGRALETIEGQGTEDALSPVQEAFRAEHGLQCGFCTPGLVMTATALLAENQHPSRQEIREAIAGNICRCTGYENIVNSIEAASRTREEE